MFVAVDNPQDELAALYLQKALRDAGSDVPLRVERSPDFRYMIPGLGPGAQRFGEKHLLAVQDLVKQGKFGSARRYLEGVKPKEGRSGLILPEDAKKLEELIQKAETAKIKIMSSIDRDPGLVRLAGDTAKNQEVKRGLDHLINELSKGALTGAGSGLEHLQGTDVIYMRTRGGARLYLRKTFGGYEIVAKSSKANQQAVLARLKQLYGKKK